MSSFTKEEYIALLQKIADSQYEDPEPDLTVEMEWIPSEPEIKKKMHLVNKDGSVDLTAAKKEKVKEILLNYKYANLQIGDFLIRITKYHGEPGQKGALITLDVAVYQYSYRTLSGAPCKMLNKLNLSKDVRFTNRPWLSYFASWGDIGYNIPIDVMVDIIRWCQAVKKLSAFV